MNLIRKEIFLKIWFFITFTMFLFQNLLLFIFIFVWSYPSGYVTISTNTYGEMILEIIVSGIFVIFSIIGLVKYNSWLGDFK